MLIEKVVNLRYTRTDNLKFRPDLQDQFEPFHSYPLLYGAIPKYFSTFITH